MPSNRLVNLVLAAAAMSLTATAHAVDVRVTVLVRPGDPVSGLDPVFTWQSIFTGISDHAINETGHVVFAGTIAGPGIDANNSTVLAAGPIGGPYRVVARGGTVAPGAAPGVGFFQPALGFLTESGRVLFYSTMSGPGITTANDAGFWLESDPPGGAPLPVLIEGGPAPGYPGLTVASFDARSVRFQPRHQVVAAVATLAGPGVTATNSSVLYLSSIAAPATLTPRARAGDLIPGQVGISHGTFGLCNFAGNPDSLDLVVRNTLVAPGITSTNDGSFLLFQPGNPVVGVVLREGNPIAGQPVGTYNQLLSPHALGNGDIGYFATVSGLAASTGAMWLGSRLGESAGPPRPLALRDTAAPGFAAGSTMASAVIDKFDVASSGRAVYAATCAGPGVTTANDTALFTEGPGGPGVPMLIAREGSLPPGLAAPSTFGAMGALYAASAINARNQTVFFAYAPTPGSSDVAGETGLWVADAAGNVQLIAHKTRPFAVTPTDVRTPALVGFRVLSTAAQVPGRKWFLDDGRLITSMFFSDNSSALLLLHVDPPVVCRADFNNDGDDTLQDLFDFLFAWFARDPRADLNGLDGVSVQDLFDFLSYWFARCP